MRIVYRADGGHPIGTGHVLRAVRILRELSRLEPIDARIVCAEDSFARRAVESAPGRLVALPARRDLSAVKPLLSAEGLNEELRREAADIVVVDMLDTPDEAMAAVADLGMPLVTMDDRGPGRCRAQAVVDVLVEEPDPAALKPGAQLFQGGEFVTLDAAFAAAHERPQARSFVESCSVFVAMGGADAAGLSVKVARALRLVDGLLNVRFVCGPAFPHREELEEAVAGAAWPFQILSSLPSLIDSYRGADICVVAGGFTMYEVCCLGAPSLAVCQPIDHQLELAARLSAAGAMESVGCGLETDEEEIADSVRRLARSPEMRRAMHRIGPTLVDGRGTERVASLLRALATQR